MRSEAKTSQEQDATVQYPYHTHITQTYNTTLEKRFKWELADPLVFKRSIPRLTPLSAPVKNKAETSPTFCASAQTEQGEEHSMAVAH